MPIFYFLSETGEYKSLQQTPWVSRFGPGFYYSQFHVTDDRAHVLFGVFSKHDSSEKQLQVMRLADGTISDLDITYQSYEGMFERENRFISSAPKMVSFSRLYWMQNLTR